MRSPRLESPAELPVSARRDDIAAALRAHQVVIVAGETGSGKTTQLPKMCLESGSLRIAHTQPRRIAARAVAERLAEEMGVPLGGFVGYRVRFTDETSADTAITVMTDGVMLASIRKDRLLRRFDTIIVDEAHERSLNIDFLLGYLAWLLPQRPDLRVVITSATLDTSRLSAHFGGAPVLEVSGRNFPVEIRYEPYDDIDEVQAVCQAVATLASETAGDILVFLSGEREIRDTADALSQALRPDTEVVPLYGRLSSAEQHRVFAAHDRQRIVLATNVAETSLTVPGIHCVVDTGSARISRYSTRLKIQRLPIEPVSQASASQRAGRCGRIADGICIRLYSADDFANRPAYTDPEILRTNLASVILQMATLGLGSVEDFPFIDPPDRRAIAAGIAVLEEVGALRPGKEAVETRLTDMGRALARIPLDPRLGRMVLEGQTMGCLEDVIIIAAGLTVRDPRERPEDRATLADTSHARFADPTSDLLSLLNLWDYVTERQSAMSSTKFRALCREEFLHYLRVREWQDLVSQVASAVRDQPGSPVNVASSGDRDGDAIHRAILAGLLSHIGMLEPRDRAASEPGRRGRREYLGARGTRFALWPGSALIPARGKEGPAWVMAAELVETSRLWARKAAAVDPRWVEELAGPLASRSHSEPLWSRRSASAVTVERVTLYGLPIVQGRRVPLARTDPVAAREWFIRHALVLDDWRHQHPELSANARVLEEAREREDRARIRDSLVDEEALVRFYDERLPEKIVDGRHFDAWWRRERHKRPHLLDLPIELVLDTSRLPTEEDFPSAWPHAVGLDASLPLSYRFDPTDPRDGVTVTVPLDMLPSLPRNAFAWQVRGLREDLITALLRGLPKQVRKDLGPAPTLASRILRRLDAVGHGQEPATALSDIVRAETGVVVAPGTWAWDALPTHLRVHVSVVDDRGNEVAHGQDLEELRARLRDEAAEAVSRALPQVATASITTWPDLARESSVDRGGHLVTAYPALVAQPDGTVVVRVLPTPEDQAAAMPRGTARLLCISEPLRTSSLRLDTGEKLALARNPQGSVHALLAECAEASALEVVSEAGGAPWSAEEFAGLAAGFRRTQTARVQSLLVALVPVMDAWWEAQELLDGIDATSLQPAADDVRRQLARLVHPGFLLDRGRSGLPDLLRYLRAVVRRLEALSTDAARDLMRMEQVRRLEDAYGRLPEQVRAAPAARDVRDGIEEFRVSLWAQDLGTARKVSEKRLLAEISALR